MRSSRLIVLVVLASLCGLAVASPARAAGVTVEFGVAAGAHAPTGGLCPVTVPAGSDGIAVLEAAKAEGCVVSYRVTTHPQFGAYVECIDEICGAPAEALGITYWRFFVDGAPSPVGISSYEASAGDEVVFSYTTWAGCLVAPDEPAIC